MSSRVIIVDDDRDTRELLAGVLAEEGFVVDSVPNGLRLISKLEVDRPDVILLDVVMQWVDGLELCRAIKRNPHFNRIPVIFVSGKTSREDIARGLEAGAVDYFHKPIDVDRLIARVHELVPRPSNGARS